MQLPDVQQWLLYMLAALAVWWVVSRIRKRRAAKRAARMIRRGSSSKDCSALTGVRRIPAARSARPPQGSTSSRSGSRSAMALTVKSRRVRSPSSVSP